MEIVHSIDKNSLQQRRIIADSIHKLIDDEKVSADVFALTMNIFDRFLNETSIENEQFDLQLIALSCYNLAKKLRTNMSITNENEQTSLILIANNYSEDEIFTAEQMILETLDWDLSVVVPHDFLILLFDSLFPSDFDRSKLRLHTEILLSLAICEINSLSIRSSLLAGACLQATIRGLSILNSCQSEERISELIRCQSKDLQSTQRLVEEYFQNCLQEFLPQRKTRRCLAPIVDATANHSSPRVK